MATRDIPEPLKRNIRKRCGYGCVICGKPIYEYHHIYGFKPKEVHIEDEIALLCGEHHAKVTRKLIPLEYVLKYNSLPHNKKTGTTTADRVWYALNYSLVQIGSNKIHVHLLDGIQFIPLMIEGWAFVSLIPEDGELLLSLSIFDPWRRPIVAIVKNEVVFQIEGLEMDLNHIAGEFTIKHQGQIFFQAALRSPTLFIKQAMFIWNGIVVDIHDGLVEINPGNKILSGMEYGFCPIGISCGRDPKNRAAATRIKVPMRLIPKKHEKGFQEIPENEIESEPVD